MKAELYILSPELRSSVDPGQEWVNLRVSDGEAMVTVATAHALNMFSEPMEIEDFLSGVSRVPEELERWREIVNRLFVLRILVPASAQAPTGKKPVLSRVNDDCTQLFLVFTGVFGGMGLKNGADPVSFLRDAGLIDRNFILFRDFSRSRYLHGISTEVPTFQSLLQWIRDFRRSHPQISRLYTIGNSMGCGTAIIAGHHLKADQVFGFSPGWVRFQQGVRESPGEGWDLPLLLRNDNGVTRYQIYYASGFHRDCEHARSLEGLPGVVLHPVETEGHNALPALINAGQLTMFPAMEAIR